ncbi:MAG: phytoene dehydrogenase-like protein, partial [Glaciecola sp.]
MNEQDNTVIVVGAGPNGLAAAVVLAQAGMDVTVLEAAETIGGGTRTQELTLPGVLHDVCSAVHPFGVASPFLSSLPLQQHGLEWLWPEVDLAHPLEHGRAGILVKDLDATVDGLGVDGEAWRRAFAPMVANFDDLIAEMFQPLLHLPAHPLLMARFGLRAMPSAKFFARRWKTDEARALFAGIAAHIVHPLTAPTTAAVGVMMGAAGHRSGWPVAQGGSQAITKSLASLLRSLGGTIETGYRVDRLAELPPAAVTMLDVAPGAVIRMAGDRLPARARKSYATWRHGPGAFKLDLAV